MSHATSSKTAAAYLIDPLSAPEPSAETGPGAHFSSTFDPDQRSSAPKLPSPTQTSNSSSSNNPFRKSSGSRTPPEKTGASAGVRPASARKSPKESFPAYRAEAFGDYAPAANRRSVSSGRPPPSYEAATSPEHNGESRHRRRTSSLRERYPGDKSNEPLEIIRRDSKKANRSPHLRKKHQPGPDIIDRLDPAIGGRPYHHEGPYDAALMARNSSFESSPVAALQSTNAEALKATPPENIKNAIERHRPLEGVADVPPGMQDRFGRVYQYEEGADLLHEDGGDGPGYKRWAGLEYSPDDLKGKGEPSFSLDKAYKAHKISDDRNGIEMKDNIKSHRRAQRGRSVDDRDPVDIAGGESRYVDSEIAHTNDADTGRERSGSGLREGLKKRIGSLRKKKRSSG